ncbi:MAG: sulfite exporter TauE/SafE family protein [Candidatus Magnetomorum sp.]|nr:sulfite exporter TauE/SafE family protein [Candidatus Magnetomorum sp.]
MIKKLSNIFEHLIFWIVLDIVYITLVFTLPDIQSPPMVIFFISHAFGIVVATMVMFTGLGAGVLWLPLLTLLGIPPSEAISLSIFTQIAGKGIGTINFLKDGIADLRVIRQFLPYSFIGILVGYLAGFFMSMKSERLLLLIFVAVAFYLLIQMLQSFYGENQQSYLPTDPLAIKNSRGIVICSSFFTGLLSIGNSDWLIPHMQERLRMSTPRAVATGIVVMFFSVVFYLFLTATTVFLGFSDWPQHTPILLSTCSGVMMGGQIGTRLTRYQWLRDHQKHAFIILLALSLIHLLW